MAAGRGERLRPLTDDRPKPMLPIGGKPVLERNLDLLIAAGIREVAINTHHRPEVVERHFGDGSRLGIAITYSREPTLLGTAGAARRLRAYLGGDDFLVVYGDNVSTIDLSALVRVHRERDADLTLALFRRDDACASGIAELDGEDRITRFLEKPRADEVFSPWVNAGYLVARPWILDVLPEGPSDFGRDAFPALLARKARMYGYRMTEALDWIDSPDDYARTARRHGEP